MLSPMGLIAAGGRAGGTFQYFSQGTKCTNLLCSNLDVPVHFPACYSYHASLELVILDGCPSMASL